jgi:heme exporter protein D
MRTNPPPSWRALGGATFLFCYIVSDLLKFLTARRAVAACGYPGDGASGEIAWLKDRAFGMETRDRIAVGALIVSIIALIVAIGSAVFTSKQYLLNVARDQREQEARLPTFDHQLEKVREVGV